MDKILLLVFVGMVIGCYYDVEEDFQVNQECNVDNISYASDVLEIVSSRCYKCHAAALNLGNVTLEGYDKIKIYVNNGKLLGAVKRESGFSPMPQNESMLPSCDILTIESWVNAGAPNN